MKIIKFRAWNNEAKVMESWKSLKNCNKSWLIHLIDGESIFKEDYKLMQFTGLFDKNGKEIYEGDIFKSVKSEAICQVHIGHYNDKLSSQHDIMGVWFKVVGIKKRFGFTKAVLTKKSCDIIEVIGNKFENPELLEGKE